MARKQSQILNEYLVACAKDGDRDAFALLVRRWQKKLIAHALRLTGDREAARDAVQTAWGDIVRGLNRLQDERAFPAWAYRIVSRACARQIGRNVRRRAIADTLAAEPETEPPDPDAGIEGARLRAAIGSLPPQQRAAIALFHFHELSIAEVAVSLDVPAGTIKTRLMHARRKLRVILEGETRCETSTR